MDGLLCREQVAQSRDHYDEIRALGAGFVVGAGPVLRYQHLDDHTTDHAPMREMLAALEAAQEERNVPTA